MLCFQHFLQKWEGIEERISETAGNADVGAGDNTRSNEKCAMALHHASLSLRLPRPCGQLSRNARK
jgi:hypothetical protein